ncbi:unnamed protein product [Closterium sp. Naga37s-1]|nr:unnamed protein product [Closterium sp. Naga37s-1]
MAGSARRKPQPLGFDVRYAVAPMVGQSDLPFRLLCRRYGATIAYTEMLHRSPAPPVSSPPSPSDAILSDPGFLSRALQSHACDGPLVAQLADNDPAEMVRAGWAVLAHMARVEQPAQAGRVQSTGEGTQGEQKRAGGREKAGETKASGEKERMGRRGEPYEMRAEGGDAAEAERREGGGGGGEAERVCRCEEGVERQGEVWDLKEGRLQSGEEGAAGTVEQRGRSIVETAGCSDDDAAECATRPSSSIANGSSSSSSSLNSSGCWCGGYGNAGECMTRGTQASPPHLAPSLCLSPPPLPPSPLVALDVNLGCPQLRAKQGHYGAYLLNDKDLPRVYAMVRAMASHLPIPIFCKIRLMPSLPQTIALCRGLQDAGCALIALHARMPAGTVKRRVGPADLAAVRAVKQALAIPVLSNGNISSPADVAANLAFTGADGAMSAEGVLHDPKILSGGITSREERLSVALEYLALCHQLGSVESGSVTWPGIRLHLEYMLGRRGAGRSVSFAHQGAYRRGWELRAALHAAASLPALRHVLLQALLPPTHASATGAPSDASAADPFSHASATHPPNPAATEPCMLQCLELGGSPFKEPSKAHAVHPTAPSGIPGEEQAHAHTHRPRIHAARCVVVEMLLPCCSMPPSFLSHSPQTNPFGVSFHSPLLPSPAPPLAPLSSLPLPLPLPLPLLLSPRLIRNRHRGCGGTTVGAGGRAEDHLISPPHAIRSGLAAAWRLQQGGAEVVVYEANARVGGKLWSHREQGFQWDAGANTMMENEPLVGRIIDDLGLHDRVVLPEQQSKRYVVKNGKPTLLPASLPEFLTTPLLSLPAKLRMLAEPLLWKRLSPGSNADEESVRSFLERHVGPEPVDYIVDPFCAGTTGSDPNDLLMKHVFHEVWELEQQHGSLLVGMVKTQMAKAKARKQQAKQQGSTAASTGAPKVLAPRPKGVSFSFQSGMQELPLSLATHIPASALRLSHRVDALSCDLHSPPHRPSWSLAVTRVGDGGSGGKGKGGKEEGAERFDAVVVTAPLSALANMPFKLSGQPQKLPIQLPVYQSMALLVNAFREEDVSSALPGFGVLVPTKEAAAHQFKSLGALFSSAMFPQRAPKGTVLLTSFVGGSRFKGLRTASMEELNAMALADLQRLLGVKAKPIFSSHMVWHEAFPELTHGYGGVLESMRKVETTTPFFYWAGNHRDGLAVGKALVGGYRAAERVLADLEATGGRHLFTMAHPEPPLMS